MFYICPHGGGVSRKGGPSDQRFNSSPAVNHNSHVNRVMISPPLILCEIHKVRQDGETQCRVSCQSLTLDRELSDVMM